MDEELQGARCLVYTESLTERLQQARLDERELDAHYRNYNPRVQHILDKTNLKINAMTDYQLIERARELKAEKQSVSMGTAPCAPSVEFKYNEYGQMELPI